MSERDVPIAATASSSSETVPLSLPQRESLASAVAAKHLPRDSLIRRLLALADILGISLALVATLALSGQALSWTELAWGVLTLPAWLVLFKLYGLYDRDIKRISHSTVDDLPWLLHAVLMGCVLLWLSYYVLPTTKLIFRDVLLFGTIAMATITLLRAAARRLAGRLRGPERVVLIGEGDSTELLLRKMRMHPEYGLNPVAQVCSSQGDSGDSATPVLEDLDEANLRSILTGSQVDRVVICESRVSQEALLDLIHRCKELCIKVSLLPELFNALGPSVEVDDVEGVTVLGINPPVLSRSSWLIKRSLDVAGSALMLALMAPVIALVAVLIKVDTRGPVFFKQRRIGKGGRPFQLVKFRTMAVGAERRTAELLSQSTDPGWLKLEHDPRITRVGRLLRLTSLDELPQFWNVLRGEMSLVGPRPLIESEHCQIEGWARSRVDLTPGITGLWQVLGRTNIPFEEMIKLDYMYVTNWSLWGDMRLILTTLPAVLTRRGAN